MLFSSPHQGETLDTPLFFPFFPQSTHSLSYPYAHAIHFTLRYATPRYDRSYVMRHSFTLPNFAIDSCLLVSTVIAFFLFFKMESSFFCLHSTESRVSFSMKGSLHHHQMHPTNDVGYGQVIYGRTDGRTDPDASSACYYDDGEDNVVLHPASELPRIYLPWPFLLFTSPGGERKTPYLVSDQSRQFFLLFDARSNQGTQHPIPQTTCRRGGSRSLQHACVCVCVRASSSWLPHAESNLV